MAERFVVTGAQGFLGRWVCAALLHAEPAGVVVGVGRSPVLRDRYSGTVTRRSEQVPAPLPPGLDVLGDPRYSYRQADVAAPEVVGPLLDEVGAEVVVHCAAALRDEAPSDLLRANALAAATLAGTVAGRPGVTLVLVSSGSVYGATAAIPLRETAACHPVDDYAATKLAAEHLATIGAARAGTPLWIARVFNLLGPGLQERHLAASLAAQLAGIACGTGPPRLRVGTLDTTRDFVDVRDAAAAVALLARAAAPPASTTIPAAGEARGVVNVASGRETPVGEVFDGLVAAVSARRDLPDLEIVTLPPRPADVPRSVASVERLEALGHRPLHALSASLGDMVDYYLERVLGAE